MRALVSLFIALPLFASQPLETETARLLPAGAAKVEVVAELQKAHEGTERAFPLVFEYGLTDRTELTVEPVLGTSIRPRSGQHASGFGDLEITLTQLLRRENGALPAFAVAVETKIPTAHNRLIGTGKADYTGYLIASKKLDRIDLHANLGYTIIGSPAGTQLKNIIDYAFAEEFHLSPRIDFVGEIIGNTSSTGETVEGAPATNPTVPPEAAGAEISALLGVRYRATPALVFALGVSYDNNHAWLIRPGITWRFGK